MDNVQSTDKELDPYLYTTYLVGAMQHTASKDDGSGMREGLDAALTARNILAINPVKLEKRKTGIDVTAQVAKAQGWITSGNWEKFREHAVAIWKGHTIVDQDTGEIRHIPGDVEYVIMSDWITFTYHKGDSPCVGPGTLVLMGDLTQKRVEDVQVGDVVKGVVRERGKSRLVNTTVVSSGMTGHKPVIVMQDIRGNKLWLTPEHEVLTRNKKHGSVYVPARECVNAFSLHVQEQNTEFVDGWIAGYLKHDGCFSSCKTNHQVICLSDKESEMQNLAAVLRARGCTPTVYIFARDGAIYWRCVTNTIRDFEYLRALSNMSGASTSKLRGWVAGSIDADGYYENESIRYTQSEAHKEHIEELIKALKTLDIPFSHQKRVRTGALLRGRWVGLGCIEHTVCIPTRYATMVPSRLSNKYQKFQCTINKLNTPITHLGSAPTTMDVYDISTGTGNFIANGMIVHNCGSFMECGIALEHNIPIYLITDIPKRELKQSLLQAIECTKGAVFHSEKEYLEFIDEKYLKSKK